MSTIEIIEQIKTLAPEERKTVFQYLSQEMGTTSLYDEFTLLGEDVEGSDMSYADAAQAEVSRHEHI